MIKFTKVNNITVKPIKTKTENKLVLGGEILGDSPYVNIMMVAPTHGGKTTTMYTILKHCMKPKNLLSLLLYHQFTMTKIGLLFVII